MKNLGYLTKRVNETVKNEAKEQEGRFRRTLLGTLAARLLGNLSIGKGTIRADGSKILRAGQDF